MPFSPHYSADEAAKFEHPQPEQFDRGHEKTPLECAHDAIALVGTPESLTASIALSRYVLGQGTECELEDALIAMCEVEEP